MAKRAAPTSIEMRKLTPVLMVEAIEPCLPFWTERLGFAKVAEVPHGDVLGFVILVKDGVEVMYQTYASVRDDVPGLLGDGPRSGTAPSTALYVEVDDVDAVERALSGLAPAVGRRRTFYGADEIGVREPGGHVVMFARQAAAPAQG